MRPTMSNRREEFLKAVEAETRTPEEIMAQLPTKRTCDGCDLCCTALEIADIGKPLGVRCSFQRLPGLGHGCSIYGKHPHACKSYACLWRVMDDFFPEWAKPEVVGFVPSIELEKTGKLVTIFLDPARPDAWRAHERMLQEFSTKWDLAVAIGGADRAIAIMTPRGNTYWRKDWPDFFQGTQVAIPAHEFFNPYDGVFGA